MNAHIDHAAEDDFLAVAETIGAIANELRRARRRFGSFASPHEGIAVIREEYLELEREVFRSPIVDADARTEAIQLAAMAARFVLELYPEGAPDA